MIRGLEHLISDFEHAEELEKIVVARATGNIYNHVFYEPLRMYFLENEELKLLLPDYIRKNRDIEHFWIFIKNNISGEGCYNNRRKYIYDSFQPLINYLEEKEFSNGSSLIKLRIAFSAVFITSSNWSISSSASVSPGKAINISRARHLNHG